MDRHSGKASSCQGELPGNTGPASNFHIMSSLDIWMIKLK